MQRDANVTADVLVVGGGGAGLAAAIEAQAHGARCVLLEKNARLGGSTAWSIGSISVNGSPHQRRHGIVDSPDAHFEDLETLAGALANRDNRALRRLLVDEIADTFAWLCDKGLVFTGPMPEPPHRVARMHNVLPNSRAFADRLGRHARALGVDIRLGIRTDALCVASGRVTGARAVDACGQTVSVHAHNVVLADGDYSAAPDLLGELASAEAARLSPVNPTASGDGHRLGRDAGGTIINGDLVRGPVMRFVPPPARTLHDALPAHPLLAQAMRIGFERLPHALIRPLMMRFLTTALGLSPGLLDAGAILVKRRAARHSHYTRYPTVSHSGTGKGLPAVHRGWARDRRRHAGPGFTRRSHSRSVRRRFQWSGRRAAGRSRPSSGLGVRVRAHRRAQRSAHAMSRTAHGAVPTAMRMTSRRTTCYQ